MKATKSSYLTLFFLTLFISSCKLKTEHTIVQGYVKTYGSETVHEGIEIELRQSLDLPLDITTSDANGWYQLEGEFDLSRTQHLYVVNTPKNHDYLSNQPNANFTIEPGGVQRMDLEIPAFCWVNIHFKNINPCDHDDIIAFNANLGGSERLLGGGVDQYFLWRTTGNRNVTFHYSTYKCNINQNLQKDFGHISAFDTVDFEVFY